MLPDRSYRPTRSLFATSALSMPPLAKRPNTPRLAHAAVQLDRLRRRVRVRAGGRPHGPPRHRHRASRHGHVPRVGREPPCLTGAPRRTGLGSGGA
uniref:Uncharacterized protein n=1 Tax=Arundo donax TaxID=35708 RepID=A0A0A9DP40_ARUDO